MLVQGRLRRAVRAVVAVAAIISAAGCNGSSAPATYPPAATLQSPTSEAVASAPIATATPMPELTPFPPASPVPTATAIQGSNCGPAATQGPWQPSNNAAPVSYTHLRAHETRHDIVC